MTNLLYKFDKPMTADDIRQWRARLNICQAHAGILLGCHERTISAYENGREIPLSVYIACVAFEHWPWLNSRIDRIIQKATYFDQIIAAASAKREATKREGRTKRK